MFDTTPTDTPALSVSGLSLSYGGVKALEDVSVTVPEGRIIGLIGPNGSGKSSFINVISGAYQGAYEGEVRIGGREMRGIPANRRAKAGLGRIFQGIRLFDTLTIEQNILLGGHIHYGSGFAGSILRTPQARRELARQRERAYEIMALFGDRLLPRAGQQVLSLSYANRRRVEIARALMSAPELLLLDEPMAGMNPHETEELTDQLRALNDTRKISMLLVEHKMQVISELCDSTYVLSSGKIITHGPVARIQADERVVEAFLG
ncbi:ABC transporter ATP-binding protein [Thioclava sp. GXIMD2076]|uniref:ABC transporter ATP-binding protein n=1 Tax=unclassified Thioclava TaxID=2621713 RepID=UPI0030CE6BFC